MTIQKQMEILGKLAKVVHNSANSEYDSAVGEFEVDGESTNSVHYYYKYNEKVYTYQDDPNLVALYGVLELHALMKSHTGGGWTKLTLTLDKNGKATTEFTYPESDETS
jgi:uncharacterized protein YkuJ